MIYSKGIKKPLLYSVRSGFLWLDVKLSVICGAETWIVNGGICRGKSRILSTILDLSYNVSLFSILKDPKLNPHIILNDFLNNNSDKITLVHSDAHLGDLEKTADNSAEKRINDLEYLSEKTKNLIIVKYFGRDCVDLGVIKIIILL